jgi:hypothetical protein
MVNTLHTKIYLGTSSFCFDLALQLKLSTIIIKYIVHLYL